MANKCLCGCDKSIAINRKFIQGHHTRLTPPMRNLNTARKNGLARRKIEYINKQCACGCGKLFSCKLGGRFINNEQLFIHGHNVNLYKGVNHPVYGKHWRLTQETIARQKKSYNKGRFIKGCKQSEECIKYLHSDEFRKKMAEQNKRLWVNQTFRDKMKQIHSRDDIRKKKISWRKPSRCDLRFISLISKYNLPYKYVGSGGVWIGNANPDFININGEKKVIEVYHTYYKKLICKYEENRKTHFRQYGFDVIFFTEKDLFKSDWESCCLNIIHLSTGVKYGK